MGPGHDRFRSLIKRRLALEVSGRGESWVADVLADLAGDLGCPDLGLLLDRLEQESVQAAAWKAVIERVTVRETYFFRDQGQMRLLREQLLPDLMRDAQGRQLRIWSAGCSTGEELYSIAMLLHRLGNPPAQLVGTDLNSAAVEEARRGIYRERALRALPAAFRSAYLKPAGAEYEVLEELRRICRFLTDNLLPNGARVQLREMDLILCRNVLIYFDRELIPPVLERFHEALRPGGLLLTGHGELHSVEPLLETIAFPDSVVYRRANGPIAGGAASRADSPGASDQALPRASVPSSPGLPPPAALVPVPTHGELAQPALPAKAPSSLHPALLCQQARAARLEGRKERARLLLRQALFLDPDAPQSYLEWALLIGDTDAERAMKHRSTALALLEHRVPEGEEAAQVARALEELERDGW